MLPGPRKCKRDSESHCKPAQPPSKVPEHGTYFRFTGNLEVNGIFYQAGSHPVVVICLDGSAAYLDAALAKDRMPNLKSMILQGSRLEARGALPSFTNVNNASIVTGVPPLQHGICG